MQDACTDERRAAPGVFPVAFDYQVRDFYPEGLCLRSFSPPLSSAGWSRFTLLRICVFKIFRKCGFQDGLVCLIGFCGVYSQAAVGRAVRTDPFMEKTYRQLADTRDAFPAPTTSAHIWEFDLPENLEPGIHSVVVESEDEFEQQQSGVLSFEVTEVAR